MTPETVTVAEVARQAGVHPSTVRRWIADGIITGYRLGPNRLRVDATEVERLLTPVVVK